VKQRSDDLLEQRSDRCPSCIRLVKQQSDDLVEQWSDDRCRYIHLVKHRSDDHLAEQHSDHHYDPRVHLQKQHSGEHLAAQFCDDHHPYIICQVEECSDDHDHLGEQHSVSHHLLYVQLYWLMRASVSFPAMLLACEGRTNQYGVKAAFWSIGLSSTTHRKH